MFIPTLETGRLLLRPWNEATDFEAYAAMTSDPDVMRYVGGKTFSQLEAWRHMALIVGHWQLRGFGHWAVEEKASGQFIGRVGCQHPVGWPGFEVGWTLAKDKWGHGYATEGARAALTYSFTQLGRDHVISLIHPDNHPSIAVAERIGETREGETHVLGFDVLIYGISRATWETNNHAK